MDLKIDFATRDHARTPQGWPIRIDGAEEAACRAVTAEVLVTLAPKLSLAFDDALRVAHHRAEIA